MHSQTFLIAILITTHSSSTGAHLTSFQSVCACVPILMGDYGQIDRFSDPFNAIVFICLRHQLMAPNWEIWGVPFLAYFEPIQAIGCRTHTTQLGNSTSVLIIGAVHQ